jgi:hypothetical protein
MTVIRTRNASSAAEPPAPPLKGDQSYYLFEMIYDGGSWRAWADTPDELLDALVPEYTGLTSPRERAAARIRLALRLQVQLQAQLDTAPELAQCTEEQRTVLLSSRENPPSVQVWDAPVPLVLVSTFYRPEGRMPRPTGPAEALIWIDPGDAWSLLRSLHQAGVVGLYASEGVLPPLGSEGGN